MADDLVRRLRACVRLKESHTWDELIEAADALARKDAEIAELRRKALHDTARIIEQGNDLSDMNDELRSIYAQRDEQRQRAERAEARVREAPVVEASPCSLPPSWVGNMPHATIAITGEVAKRIGGKRVALVLLDTEEGK